MHSVHPTPLSLIHIFNFQMTFNPNQHFHIPELGIDGDYLHTFQKLTEITWKIFKQGMLVCHQAFFPRHTLVEPYNLQYRFSADFEMCIRDRCTLRPGDSPLG